MGFRDNNNLYNELIQEKMRRQQAGQLLKEAPDRDMPPPAAIPDGATPDTLYFDLLEEKKRREVEKENQPFYQPILETVAEVGEQIDRYTGAPVRSAIYSMQKGGNLLDAGGAYVDQFGEPTETAPTGKQIAVQAGVPQDVSLADISPSIPSFGGPDETLKKRGFDIQEERPKFIEKGDFMDISPAGAAGLAIEIVADPLNLITAGSAKAAVKGARSLMAKGSKSAKRVAKMINESKAVMKGSEAAARMKNADNIIIQSRRALGRSFDKIFNPRVADDFGDLARIAEKNGISIRDLPESIEFGRDSFISRRARSIAEGPLGQEKLLKFNDATEKVSSALKNKISSIGGGQTLDKVSAGRVIRDGYNKGVDDFFKQMDITYNTIDKMAPGMPMTQKSLGAFTSKINGVEKYAKGLLKRGISATDRSQAKELLNAVKAAKNTNGSFKQAKEALQMIGRTAFKTGSSASELPSDIKRLREIYFNLSDALVDTAKANLGDDIAKQLVKNNKAMNSFFGKQSSLKGVIGNKNLADEQVFKRIVESGNTKQLDDLAAILPPQEFQKLKGSFLDSVIKVNQDGDIMYRSSANSLKNKLHLAKKILTKPELEEVTEILRLGDRMGAKFLSSSGTGASNMFADIGKAVKGSVENEALLEAAKRRARAASMAGKYKNSSKAGKGVKDILSGESKARKTLRNIEGTVRNKIEPVKKTARGSRVINQQKTQGLFGDNNKSRKNARLFNEKK